MRPRRGVIFGWVVAFVVMLPALTRVHAQGRGGTPPLSPRASAPTDLVGTWVSVVTEDWRWRMLTPPKGDFASLPLNPEGTRVGNTWEPRMDGRCEAYGAAALLRLPTRVRIDWESDTVLLLETDAGRQVRRLVFGDIADGSTGPSLQGSSSASWIRPAAVRAGGLGGQVAPAGPGGSLRVVTTNLSGGWLRQNGAPYSDRATMTEYFNRVQGPDGNEWFTVITLVRDPKYLTQDFITSSHFKKEADNTRWNPVACRQAP